MATINSRRLLHLLSRRLVVTHPAPSIHRSFNISLTLLQKLGVPTELISSPVIAGGFGLRKFSRHSSSSSLPYCLAREKLLLRQRQHRSSSSSWPYHHPILYGGKCQTFSTQTDKPPPSSVKQENGENEKQKDKKAATDKKLLLETSDPVILTWVDYYLPQSIQPYARLARIDKPIGTWLLFYPCCFSTALSVDTVGTLPDFYLITLFGIGSIIMRGAGCTINDLWDAKYDSQVIRCQNRPLAAGDITVPQAIIFLSLQLTTGLIVLLSLPHTLYCFQWGIASLPLVIIYPLMKRFFPYPQLILGLTFNWGVWMGWAAVHGSMDFNITAPLYVSCVAWTLVYDTIYGHQDKHDDAKLGLHSTALTFGKDDAVQKQIMYSLATLSGLSWLYLGQVSDMANVPIHNVGVMAAYGHLLWQINTADLNDPHNLAERFRSNHWVGALLFGSMVAGKFFA